MFIFIFQSNLSILMILITVTIVSRLFTIGSRVQVVFLPSMWFPMASQVKSSICAIVQLWQFSKMMS